MWPNPQESADLVTFTGDILNGKTSFFVQWRLLNIEADTQSRAVKDSSAWKLNPSVF